MEDLLFPRNQVVERSRLTPTAEAAEWRSLTWKKTWSRNVKLQFFHLNLYQVHAESFLSLFFAHDTIALDKVAIIYQFPILVLRKTL